MNYVDTFLYAKDDDSEKKERVLSFPFTRFDNVLNRPRVTENPIEEPNPDFLLVVTETGEMDDSDVFNLIGKEW